MACCLKKNHNKAGRLGGSYLICPLLGKEICFWCCLHISDRANPLLRGNAEAGDYEDITDMTNRTWDSIWEVCSKCQKTS